MFKNVITKGNWSHGDAKKRKRMDLVHKNRLRKVGVSQMYAGNKNDTTRIRTADPEGIR